ncbi:hypothetical protein SESBI_38044 [Sesbania bispinosa]|nr:hypothetical protein SESBI_38044 [Sesbania bispinosa]
MVKSLRLNSKRVYNNQPTLHLLEKQVNESQPNDTPNTSKLVNVEQVEADAGKVVIKKGRGDTINAKLQKKKAQMMVEGKKLDIQFPPPYYKLCGTHANYFKSEAAVCIRQRASFQVNCWKEMSTDDVDEMWIHMKEALNLPEKVKEYAMKQVQSQYKNK